MASEDTLTTELDPPIVDHGDGSPPVEDDASIAAPAEGDAASGSDPEQQSATGQQEELARTRGWVEKAKWKGGGWVDASAFNDRYEQVMPHLSRENRRVREEMRARDTEIAQMRAEISDMRKHQQDQQEASRTIHVQTLIAQKAQAESEGDWQTANKIGNDLLKMEVRDQFRQVAPAPTKSQEQQLNPSVKAMIDDFVADNPAFADEDKKVYLAVAAKQLAEANTPKRGRELLDEAAELAQNLFPTKFKQPQRRPAMAEMNGAPSRAPSAVRSWADLKPDEARKQDQFLADNFPKADAKTMNGLRQKLVKELPATAFRR